MSRPRFWHRVRFKLLLVSLTLLGIPWAGYRFIQETESFLREAQDQSLRTTASSVANIMHGYADEFHGVARPGSVLTFRNLFMHSMKKTPQLDGYRDEWITYERNFTVLQSIDETLEARMFLAEDERYAYLFLGVKDPSGDLGIDGDAVEIALTDANSELQRYRIRPDAPGWVVAQRLPSGGGSIETVEYEPAIRGEWQPNPQGYTLELRFPRELVRERLSLRILDSRSRQMLANGRMYPAEALGLVVRRSEPLQNALAGLTPPATRIWVTDHQGLVLAQSGRLDSDAPLHTDEARMPWFIQELILAVLPRDADTQAGLSKRRTHLFMAPVVEALAGRPGNLRRQPPQGNAVVVSAAVPIRSGEGIRGAVLVEQTTNAILSIQNLALQRLFGVTLLLFAITSLGLLAFASLLASRITHLRDKVESAVSHDGRIVGRLDADRSKDEIGDLGRSFASVLDRLHDYNHYLEAMASRLAHELRTPLAVVRSSLDNADQAVDTERAGYIQRARDGAERLELILMRLREATGLEQAMRQAEREHFDLAALVRMQTAGFQTLYPSIHFALKGVDQPVMLNGVPDLISQALDKLVNNAVDFHTPGTTIELVCTARDNRVELAIGNQGPTLPPDTDVFQSMVSGRRGRQDEPHLGLGLYLVRLIAEFHGGGASAENRTDQSGVVVTLRLPADR